jgi:hypothetical protein
LGTCEVIRVFLWLWVPPSKPGKGLDANFLLLLGFGVQFCSVCYKYLVKTWAWDYIRKTQVWSDMPAMWFILWYSLSGFPYLLLEKKKEKITYLYWMLGKLNGENMWEHLLMLSAKLPPSSCFEFFKNKTCTGEHINHKCAVTQFINWVHLSN